MATATDFAALIEDLLEKRVSCDQASKTVLLLGKEFAESRPGKRIPLVEEAFEAIIHFCSDEDIRSKDQLYAANQINSLRVLRARLLEERS